MSGAHAFAILTQDEPDTLLLHGQPIRLHAQKPPAPTHGIGLVVATVRELGEADVLQVTTRAGLSRSVARKAPGVASRQTMAKTRLYSHAREVLLKFADKLVTCPDEAAAERRALVALQAAADEAIVAAFPSAHMDLLATYEASYVRDNWPGNAMTFDLKPARLMPRGFTGRTFDQRVPDQAAVVAAHAVWQAAVKALQSARAAALAPYKALINGSRTFEDVVEVWPEAVAMREPIGVPAQLPSVVTADMRAAIAADVERRRNARPPHHAEAIA